MATKTQLDPESKIEQLPELMKQITRQCSALHAEIDGIVERWAQLKQVGGQRADHAAEMMACLRFHLDDLAGFCTDVSDEITEMKANPFCR